MIISVAKQVLEIPFVFEAYQSLVGAPSCHRRFIDTFVKARPGNRVLDVGCGTGVSLLYLPKVDYVGVDLSPSYIERAKQRFGNQGRFICGDASQVMDQVGGGFDRIFATGVLHHVSDEVAAKIIGDVLPLLAPGGTFTTIDPTIHPEQGSVSRALVMNDRGQFVRNEQQMRELFRPFGDADFEVTTDMMRIPFSQIIVSRASHAAEEIGHQAVEVVVQHLKGKAMAAGASGS